MHTWQAWPILAPWDQWALALKGVCMPTTRRSKGDGTIRKRADGRWEARLELGRGENGKLRVQSFYGATRREVTEKIREAQRQVEQGVSLATNKQTVQEFLNYWLEHVAKP